MNIKTAIVSIFLLYPVNTAYCQDNDSTFSSRNTIYTELASKGAYYSINYDRIFHQKNKLIYSFKIGFSIFNNIVALPLGFSLFVGKQKHHLEYSLIVMPYIENYRSFLSSNDLSDKFLYIIPGFGYRFQKKEGGFFFKTAFSPMLILDPHSNDFWKMDSEVKLMLSIGAGFNF